MQTNSTCWMDAIQDNSFYLNYAFMSIATNSYDTYS